MASKPVRIPRALSLPQGIWNIDEPSPHSAFLSLLRFSLTPYLVLVSPYVCASSKSGLPRSDSMRCFLFPFFPPPVSPWIEFISFFDSNLFSVREVFFGLFHGRRDPFATNQYGLPNLIGAIPVSCSPFCGCCRPQGH